MRGRITRASDGWVLTLTPMWLRDAGLTAGQQARAEWNRKARSAPTWPMTSRALAANPAAAAFFDTLAQFYRKAYLR